ncbi:PREDICTED: coatomer subunit beta'-like, partial [Rhagoletis zephyria]|uniref:coatomer subunit beta'-like n=1 Tax=Rhagoletis zephyria TaxID=28612 RepID=UPI0008114F82
PLKLDVRRKLLAHSDRVKCVDLHPVEPWLLCGLYSGHVHIWNYETQLLLKSFDVCDVPVRCSKFIPTKNWIVTGADDMQVRVFNYNTLEKVHTFDAHSDYIRSIVVHPTQPYILTSSDDMIIKLWNWEKSWACTQVFEGHTHYVMQVVVNPKDSNTFASASLDRTVKVWQLGSNAPNFTLEGHDKGVNCVDYCHSGDKPYLISGADDRLVKIWDYQTKTCVQTLDGHAQNVVAVSFHPELPIFMSGSEDGTVRVWHLNTYRLENTLNYGLERAWTIACLKGSNTVAIGYDIGSLVIKLGREEPAMSMDSSGKIVWARHAELQHANIRSLGSGGASNEAGGGDQETIKDGNILPLAVKDMGSCEIYPQTISHNPNGRFVVVCGDGEYIIYTALTLRNKSFGSAQEFVWAQDSSEYAVREHNSTVKIFKNFKEKKSFKPDTAADGIFGGFMLGVRSPAGSLAFYEWDSLELIRRIEIAPKAVYWSENGELVAIASEDSFYILRYNPEAVSRAFEGGDAAENEAITDDGIEDAFDVVGEVAETVKTGLWIGDCFIYTNHLNRLNYFVGGEIVTISHMDRAMYLLGYISRENRLYLGDKELNVVSYSLLLPVLEYQTAVMRNDFEVADRILPAIPREQRTRVAQFLEKQGYRHQALAVSTDPEHRFDLAISLSDTKTAYQLALEAQSDAKWKELAKLATSLCEFDLAQQCYSNASDYSALLLLATSTGNAAMVGRLAEMAREKDIYNASFLSYFILGDLRQALAVLVETGRLPEAAFFARAYLPSEVSRVLALWKETPKGRTDKSVQALADPNQYENLFPNFQQALRAAEERDRALGVTADEGSASGSSTGPTRRFRARDYLAVKERLESGGEPAALQLLLQQEESGDGLSLSAKMDRLTVAEEAGKRTEDVEEEIEAYRGGEEEEEEEEEVEFSDAD